MLVVELGSDPRKQQSGSEVGKGRKQARTECVNAQLFTVSKWDSILMGPLGDCIPQLSELSPLQGQGNWVFTPSS